jgi:hypothetical protein
MAAAVVAIAIAAVGASVNDKAEMLSCYIVGSNCIILDLNSSLLPRQSIY